MRVLALMTDAFGGRGGIAQYNRDLLCALAKSSAIDEIKVLLRCPQSDQEAGAPPAGVQQRYSSGSLALSIAALTSANSAEVVLCGHIRLLPAAAAAAWRTRTVLWLQIYGIDAWAPPNRLVGPRLLSRVDLVTSLSRFTRRRFLAWSCVEDERVRVLPCTVEARFTPGEPSRPVRDLYNLGKGPLLLTVGRLAGSERYKGHDRIIKALPEVLAYRPGTIYAIAGDGNDRCRLQEIARAAGVAGEVRFLGKVPERDLPDLYRSADLFVMPSTGEGFGIVFLEAMASGTSALGFGADGSCDPLQDGRLGTLSTAGHLAGDIVRTLSATRPSDLAARTRNAFGKRPFAANVAAILRHVKELRKQRELHEPLSWFMRC